MILIWIRDSSPYANGGLENIVLSVNFISDLKICGCKNMTGPTGLTRYIMLGMGCISGLSDMHLCRVFSLFFYFYFFNFVFQSVGFFPYIIRKPANQVIHHFQLVSLFSQFRVNTESKTHELVGKAASTHKMSLLNRLVDKLIISYIIGCY